MRNKLGKIIRRLIYVSLFLVTQITYCPAAFSQTTNQFQNFMNTVEMSVTSTPSNLLVGGENLSANLTLKGVSKISPSFTVMLNAKFENGAWVLSKPAFTGSLPSGMNPPVFLLDRTGRNVMVKINSGASYIMAWNIQGQSKVVSALSIDVQRISVDFSSRSFNKIQLAAPRSNQPSGIVDLAVTKIVAVPTQGTVGFRSDFTMTIKNVGTQTSLAGSNFDFSIFNKQTINGVTYSWERSWTGIGNMPALAPGEEWKFTTIGQPLDGMPRTGIYKVTGKVSNYEDENFANDQLIINYMVGAAPIPLPDLTVTQFFAELPAVGGIDASNYTTKVGDSLYFTTTFQNQGNANAGPHKLAIYVGAGVVASCNVPSLPSGTMQTYVCGPWAPPLIGTYPIKAVIDSDNQVNESNEMNNAPMNKTLTVYQVLIAAGGTTSVLRNDFSGWIGFGFKVGATPMTVTDLGRYVVAGSSGMHRVKLVNASGVDVPGAFVDVNTAGVAAGQYAYTALPSSVVLQVGAMYYLVSQQLYGSSADKWYDFSGNSIFLSNVVTPVGPVYAYTGTTNYINISPNTAQTYGPLNLKFK